MSPIASVRICFRKPGSGCPAFADQCLHWKCGRAEDFSTQGILGQSGHGPLAEVQSARGKERHASMIARRRRRTEFIPIANRGDHRFGGFNQIINRRVERDHNRFNTPGRSGSKVLLPRRRYSRATQGNQRADPQGSGFCVLDLPRRPPLRCTGCAHSQLPERPQVDSE